MLPVLCCCVAALSPLAAYEIVGWVSGFQGTRCDAHSITVAPWLRSYQLLNCCCVLVGIAGVSGKFRTKAEVKAAKEEAQAQKQSEGGSAASASGGLRKRQKGKHKAKQVGHSGRGASDYFMLEASLDGVATEILRDHSTVRTRRILVQPTPIRHAVFRSERMPNAFSLLVASRVLTAWASGWCRVSMLRFASRAIGSRPL